MVLRRSLIDTAGELEPSCVSDNVGDSGRAGYETCPPSSTSQRQSYDGGKDGEQAGERTYLAASWRTKPLVGKILLRY